MGRSAWLVVAAMVAATSAAHADPLAEKDVPEPLKPWVGWVLDGQETERCTFFHGRGGKQCAWPATLSLELDDSGGRFTQDWRVDAPVWVALPGEAKRWPLDVRADGTAVGAVDRGGQPMTRLEKGDWRVTGSFAWDRLPELIQVPAETGIVSLTVRGRRVEFPSRDEQGRLWLQREQTSEEGESRLEVAVHRQVIDDIPLTLVTDVVLKVSGKNREVLLGRSLPDRFVPLSLTGPLPARVEADGRLRVQVRPGTWRLTLSARHEGPADAITLPALAKDDGPWDEDEAWVFEARPALRLVTVEGVPSIDAQQTELPDSWRSLPAYLVRPGDTMKLVQRQRGDEEPAPDRLSLDRTWWLDFDGGGWTLQDRVGGTLSRSWRLEMAPETTLGRVAVDGADQFITGSGNSPRGIEVRQTQVSLEADSRIDRRTSSVPAVSWAHDFESVNGRVQLPPGWRLIHAFGVDRADPTWIAEWDLLDLFLLLIIALSVGRLWGARAGALALVALGLAWHEPGAPRWVWLFLLVGEALFRVLPAGVFKTIFRVYRWLVWGVLVLLAVPFLVLQVRNALYPQLEPTWSAGWLDRLGGFDGGLVTGKAAPPMGGAMNAPAEPMAMDENGRFEGLEDKVLKEMPASETDVSGFRASFQQEQTKAPQKARMMNVYAPDPRAQVSTGPGLPSWTWRDVSLTWRGPVDAEQRIRFLLVPPWLHVILSLARTVLTAALVLLVLGFPVARWARGRFRAGSAAAAALLLGMALLFPSPALAQGEPSKETLEELKRRLLEKPECAPTCASIGRMRVEVSGSTFRARLEIAAAAETAVPLPGGAQQWSAGAVFLDGSPAKGLLRSRDGVLWIPLEPGAHQVVVEGPLPDRETVQVPLPMKARHVQASVSGWILDGIHEDGQPDDTLQLTRARSSGGAAAGLQQETLPPFLRVERRVRLDLSWQVTTRVLRLTPPGAAVVVEVPLVPGESVTSADVRVQNGKVAVSMGPTASLVEWTSVLGEADAMTLTASTSGAWAENWRVDASPMWHVDASGIPVVQRPANIAREREWRPWPGEKVSLAISRPEGAPGQTLTLDGASLVVSPGLRSTDATLTLSVRSSRGGQHVLTLPEDAELTMVTLDGVTQPVRQVDRKVTLPVSPGPHAAMVAWRQKGGISLFYRTPPVELGAPAVNAEVRVSMPADRWTLFLSGPRLGPAVLFWSLLAVYLAISVGLGQVTLTPLRWWQWFLLGLGLTQVPIPVAAVVASWLLTLGWRAKRPPENAALFDLVQLALPLFTLVAIVCLFASIAEGLLGMPEMQIRGNGSYASSLVWFQDRVGSTIPRARIASVPLMVYRLAMLAWALWLAWSLLGWLRWAWTCFTTGGVWRATPRKPAAPDAPGKAGAP